MKKFFAVPACMLLLLCCACGQAGPVQIANTDTAMGTVIVQKLYTADSQSRAAQEIMDLLRELEAQELSRRMDTSEVWNLNAGAGRPEGIPVSPSMEKLLEGCLDMWQKSQGAFDVTLGPVVELWDIDGWAAGENGGDFSLPEDRQLAEALERCGSGRLELRDGILRLPEGMQLDLGAAGKGVAMDRILSYLQGNDTITGAIISLGGSVVTYGSKPDGGCWKVGITDPADTASLVGTLALEGGWFVSTSGDYERYMELDGIRYHHIIDPATGYPADSGTAGVTILAGNGFLSDALSTACFILGEEQGTALAESCGAEVLFVGRDGRITMSRGMEAYFEAAE